MEIEGISLEELSQSTLTVQDNAPINAEEKDRLDRVKSATQPFIGNLGYVAVTLACKVEQFVNTKISNYIQEASKIQKNLDLLVDLNGKLAIPSEKENELTITPEIREICNSLKENGINLISEKETKLSREKLAEIKANASAHIERLKSSLQILFTTKIQVNIQEIQSLLDSAKKVEESSRSTRIIANLRRGEGG